MKSPKRKPPTSLPLRGDDAKMPAMKLLVFNLSVVFFTTIFCFQASGQTSPGDNGEKSSAQLEALGKKMDEQNTKIDALSQQILKLEQQISTIRPGIMIGESTPTPAASSATTPIPVAVPASGNAHVVTKGETLTSIAKANRVGVQDLQKFNHIENDRALQIGQTIMIPNAAAASPSVSPPPGAPNE